MRSPDASFEAALARHTLERLDVTDTVYHDLRYAEPLVVEILRAIRARPRAKRILLIAANATIEHALTALGYEVDAWQAEGATPTSEPVAAASATRPLDDVLRSEVRGDYDVVLLPFVLEAATDGPVAVLGRMRSLVGRDGALVVISRHQGALHLRMRAVAGHTTLGASADRRTVSWSWPTLPERRLFETGELHSWAREARYRVATERFILDREAFLRVDALGMTRWIGAIAAHRVKRAVPSLRDAVLHVLEPVTARVSEDAHPRVSVVVASSGVERTRAAIEVLAAQTYPNDRLEVLVLQGSRPTPDFGAPDGAPTVRTFVTHRPDGPVAANAALLEATGEVIALTDDRCRLPAGWVGTGVAHLRSATVAVGGVVMPDAGSPLAYMVAPDATPSSGRTTYLAGNAFFVREALQEAGGFDERFELSSFEAWGWVDTAARRLSRLGYACAFDETLYVFRAPPAAETAAWLRDEFTRARSVPWGVRLIPEHRDALHRGAFASRRAFAFDLLLLGGVLSVVRRRPAWALLGLPWLKAIGPHMDLWPPTEWVGTLRRLGWIAAHHAAWFSGAIVGSAESRRLVL